MEKFTKVQYTKGCFVMIVWVPLILLHNVLNFISKYNDKAADFLYDWVRR